MGRVEADDHGDLREVMAMVAGGSTGGAARLSLLGVIDWLNRLAPSGLLVIAGCLVGVIGVGDYVTGPDVSFAVAYLVPVFLGAAAGRRTSTAIAAVAALTWSGVELIFRDHPYTNVVVPAWNVVARFLVLWLVATLVSALAAKLAQERHLSRTDLLTGLRNGRAFREAANVEIARMRRTSGTLTAAYVDIDDFKTINDRYGHAGGDQALILAGQVMATGLRRTDVVARIGGDEFAVLLPDTGLEDALDRLGVLHEQLRAATAAGMPAVGFSVGAVTFIDPPRTADHLLSVADGVMYQVKRHGKNTVRVEPAYASPPIEPAANGSPTGLDHGSPLAA